MNEQNSAQSQTSPGFDPEKAARLRGQAQDAFAARYRKAARLTWVYLLGSTLAAWWCVRQFLIADDARSWVLWATLFAMAFGTTVLVKLWYWVVNSKLGVLRELKLLRFDLTLQRGPLDKLEELARVESPTQVPGISKREGYAWTAGLVLGILLITLEIGRNADRHYRASGHMISESRVTLSKEGAAQVQGTYTLANSTSRTLNEFTVYSGGTIPRTEKIAPADSPWSDDQQRKLAVVREPDPNGPNYRDRIQLLEPVPPGQSFVLSTTFTLHAKQENGVWVFTHDQNWGYRQNFYRDTVVLPAGAELVSCEPGPTRMEQQGGATVIYLQGQRSSGAKWSYVVKYRLAR